MNYKYFSLLVVFFLMSFSNFPETANTPNSNVAVNLSVYNQLEANTCDMPSFDCFDMALSGFRLLKEKGLVEKNVLTVIDFSLSSISKRLWVIDLDKNKILFHSLVAHGRNTGEEYATEFSNQPESNKSSVGFYATGEVYNGKHGLSLKLDGLEKGLNDNARKRSVVVHGADYVSESFIQQKKRLGKSQGCPALPVELTYKIINVIKGKSCLFIYHPSKNQEIVSKLMS